MSVIEDSGVQQEANEISSGQLIFTADQLRGAIAIEADRLRQVFADDWIADCMIRTKERGFGKDCQHEQAAALTPSLQTGQEAAAATFADVLRPELHARLTRSLEQQNRRLKPLANAGGVTGQLALERYRINFQQVLYLNGNPSPYGPANQFNCRRAPCVYKYTPFLVTRPEPARDPDAFVRRTTPFGAPR